MIIRLINKGKRNMLVCTRDNGSTEMSELGPNTPFHDLSHYVVEKNLDLSEGFYGNIMQGYTVAELSDKQVIKTLPEEAMVAEIVTRALQSLYSGACRPHQFIEIINEELDKLRIKYELSVSPAEQEKMLVEYDMLINQWRSLPEGEFMELELSFATS
jgi:hypothetical protein